MMPAIPTFPKGYTKQWKQNQQRRIAETKYIYYTVPANPAESKEDYQEIIYAVHPRHRTGKCFRVELAVKAISTLCEEEVKMARIDSQEKWVSFLEVLDTLDNKGKKDVIETWLEAENEILSDLKRGRE